MNATDKIKMGINYIVTKASDDGLFAVGERLRVSYNKGFSFGEYQTMGPPKKTDKPLAGMPALNHCRYFNTIASLRNALAGIEVVPNTAWAEEYIALKQSKIDKVKKDYLLC